MFMLFRVMSLVGIGVSASAPAQLGSHDGGATMMLSPAVVASWFTDQTAGSAVQLRLLVLWRGTPAWFLAGGGEIRGGASGLHVIYGDVHLTVSFDADARVAVVQGKRLELREDNVVFVDDVDTTAGPRVVATMRLGPAMPGSAGQLGVMLAKSPRIIEFLRCDAKAPDGRGQGFQSFLDTLCLQNIGIIR
jgi:hypothetical protein